MARIGPGAWGDASGPVEWAGIEGKPSSAPGDIDKAVALRQRLFEVSVSGNSVTVKGGRVLVPSSTGKKAQTIADYTYSHPVGQDRWYFYDPRTNVITSGVTGSTQIPYYCWPIAEVIGGTPHVVRDVRTFGPVGRVRVGYFGSASPNVFPDVAEMFAFNTSFSNSVFTLNKPQRLSGHAFEDGESFKLCISQRHVFGSPTQINVAPNAYVFGEAVPDFKVGEAVGDTTYFGLIYNSASDRWHVVSKSGGFV